MMYGRSQSAEAFFAGWTRARLDLLGASVDRVFALLSAPRVVDEGWRAAVAVEVALWGALRGAEAPPVPARHATIHARGVELLALLAAAGVDLRAAVDGRDPELLARAMSGLDDAEKVARTVFAAALALEDWPEAGT